MARAVSVLLAAMSMVSHRQISFRRSVAEFGMYGTVHLSGRHFRPAFGRACHEIVVRLCCAFSRRCFVNCLAVRPGSVANPNRLHQTASQHHGRSAEAGGKAKSFEAGGKHSGIAPQIANVIVNGSNAIACAGLNIGEDCRAGESRQQLQRWLRIKPPTRQGSMGWV
jgi:hypothetical protein